MPVIANRIILPAGSRGQIRPIWGAGTITYVTADGKKSYTVRHSKRQAWRTSLPVLRAMLRVWFTYPQLRSRWQSGYQELTDPGFWPKTLKLTAADLPPAE